MSDSNFVHLHCQSEFSVENSLIRIPALIDKVKAMDMNAIALTDESNLFTAIKFYQQAISANIKPIFGARINLKNGIEDVHSTLLLCQNRQGYLNLSKLVSLSYTQERSINGVCVTEEQLKKHQLGLIMIATPIHSDVGKYLLSNQLNKAKQKAQFWQKVFSNRYYLAVQRTFRENDERHLHLCVDLAVSLKIAIVATNDVQFLSQDNFNAHEARICIAQGVLLDDMRRKRYFSKEQFLKSSEEMHQLFSDLPETLKNTVELSKRCNVHFEIYENKKNHLPDFPVPTGLTTNDFFIQQSKYGLLQLIKKLKLNQETYTQRLQFEINVIIKMDFSGYFLIVADFIKWSKQNDIPVGPGRGSGAGSLVAYALGITNVDPIKHDLLFERFLNPERVSMPDFDIDFCADRRDEVIDYVANKYGRDKVSQIITYGTMAAKGVVRDVGRVLGHPYGFSDTLSKLIPNDLKMTLSKALSTPKKGGSEELRARYNSEESVTTLIDLSKELEGMIRNVGTHAGGVVIAPSKISDFCPVYKGADDNDSIISQFDKDDVEAIGLVKFDFLGLSNLTVIQKTIKMIANHGLSDKPIDLDKLPLDDQKVFQLLQKCDTTGVFQLESIGMRGYLKKLQADSFEDIVAMLALYRPGPLDAGMVDDYINVKHGAKAKYPHPMLKKILKPTNGIFLYQEQVMQSAQVMAGYSLANADSLRRVMSKKKTEEMNSQRLTFVTGAAKNNIQEKKANKIFDLIDKFSGYGFNKSHSVAYAYISYHTAWLKAYYPAPFMAAVLSGMMDDTDRISFTINETLKIGLIINGPNVCESNYEFNILDKKTIIYGLGAIKGVGKALLTAMVLERDNHGTYIDLFNFCYRIDKHYLNKRAIEALIYSGSFDVFGIDRASLIKTYPVAIKQAEQRQTDGTNGQTSLFANVTQYTDYETHYLDAPSLSFKKKLQLEKSVMGYYFYNHPTDEYQSSLKNIKAVLPSQLVFRNNKTVYVLALISQLRYQTSKNGKQFATMTIEDNSKQLNAVVFNKELQTINDKLIVDEIVIILGTFNKDSRGQLQIVVDTIKTIDETITNIAKNFEIILNVEHQPIIPKLAQLLLRHKGRCPIKISYTTDYLKGNIPLGKQFLVTPNQQLIDAVNHLTQNKTSKINYR